MRLRMREIDESVRWLRACWRRLRPPGPVALAPLGPLAPDTLCVSVRKAFAARWCRPWRPAPTAGCCTTRCRIRRCFNWFGLALSVRDNEISDFPICNKSFDLSYCGNDL
jgi:hypothetical protein